VFGHNLLTNGSILTFFGVTVSIGKRNKTTFLNFNPFGRHSFAQLVGVIVGVAPC